MRNLEWSLGILLASADIPESNGSSIENCGDNRFYTVGSIGVIGKGDVKIEMYGKEHYPHHFHVSTSDSEIDATFNLITCEYLGGTLPQKYKKPVNDWHKIHKNELVSEWNKRNPTMKI